MDGQAKRHCYCIHGMRLCVQTSLHAVQRDIDQLIGAWGADDSSSADSSSSAHEIRGIIKPFDLAEISRHVSPKAATIPVGDDLIELYGQDDRYWLVDERWGMCEINLLKRQWRSWVLPAPTIDPVRCVEAAVLWPAAQLMRMRGMELLAAISIERGGWGGLIIAPYPIRPELSHLMRAGYRVIGQRWTALRRHADGIDLLPGPGLTETPALSTAGPDHPQSWQLGIESQWTDLCSGNPWATAPRADCRAVFVVAPGRRSITTGDDAPKSAAVSLLRRSWPIVELPNHRRRLGDAASILGQNCCCVSVQLSRFTDDFVKLVDSVRRRTQRSRAKVTGKKVLVNVSPAVRQASLKPKLKSPVPAPSL